MHHEEVAIKYQSKVITFEHINFLGAKQQDIMPKKIFISYSDSDKSKMRSLQKLIARTSFFTPVIIADNREPTNLLSDKVKKGIRECDYIIPILTNNSINTQWINQEIGYSVALEKAICPIVEENIMANLRGFIHKQLDLPYTFAKNDNFRSEASRFTLVARKLINDLFFENNKVPKNLTIEDLFPGKWESTFNINGKIYQEHNIEIKDRNKYYVKGVHEFNLSNITIDEKNKTVSFLKTGVRKLRLQIDSKLDMMEIGKHYSGVENNSKVGKNISIEYRRTDIF